MRRFGSSNFSSFSSFSRFNRFNSFSSFSRSSYQFNPRYFSGGGREDLIDESAQVVLKCIPTDLLSSPMQPGHIWPTMDWKELNKMMAQMMHLSFSGNGRSDRNTKWSGIYNKELSDKEVTVPFFPEGKYHKKDLDPYEKSAKKKQHVLDPSIFSYDRAEAEMMKVWDVENQPIPPYVLTASTGKVKDKTQLKVANNCVTETLRFLQSISKIRGLLGEEGQNLFVRTEFGFFTPVSQGVLTQLWLSGRDVRGIDATTGDLFDFVIEMEAWAKQQQKNKNQKKEEHRKRQNERLPALLEPEPKSTALMELPEKEDRF